MAEMSFKYFKYEMALGNAIPMPEPKIDFFPNRQYSFQQYLHTLCKENEGALGKQGGKWAFGPKYEPTVKLSTRADFTELLDFAEQLGVLEAAASEETQTVGEEPFVPYRLSEAYRNRFDKFAS